MKFLSFLASYNFSIVKQLFTLNGNFNSESNENINSKSFKLKLF